MKSRSAPSVKMVRVARVAQVAQVALLILAQHLASSIADLISPAISKKMEPVVSPSQALVDLSTNAPRTHALADLSVFHSPAMVLKTARVVRFVVEQPPNKEAQTLLVQPSARHPPTAKHSSFATKTRTALEERPARFVMLDPSGSQ